MRISRCGDLISQIKHVGGRVFEHLLQQSGVEAFNGPQGRILDALWQSDGSASREVSQRTGLAPSTLTSMLDRMEATGLLRRQSDPDDRRITRLYLTEQAQALKSRYEAVSGQMTEVYFRGFSDDEIECLESLLTRVLQNVKEYDVHG